MILNNFFLKKQRNNILYCITKYLTRSELVSLIHDFITHNIEPDWDTKLVLTFTKEEFKILKDLHFAQHNVRNIEIYSFNGLDWFKVEVI